ncbi:NmrA-like family domain-containing protein 1 [Fulvia fulva]|uniref:NmrA-like family domain-containing protein 1 n=1 Tax=Passalora fulva TaxID=5499 RepID=A0A9Q8LJ76_PASFU|nr:NmrA-like family domain-containing protein 1 [Fulvia fulva]KAK4624584.1 NmrA-like family domain-containing protein 1 [Fulvia fulva]KAK4625429.1 NmrA-like family domain-containing protein 1 [Fulvia fulva]UJO18387.1 NmrA-like family domain-containing protein 1 [Fulvia fulva]WPV15347.1 NmrA-like family domain-containing protein 1 [Fulvia fulva]WPV29530.1 NmrA-like family domain-containing protein 1 [Fulvia fulva]
MADDNPEDNPPVEEEQQEEPTAEEEAEGPKRIVICGATGRLGGSVLRRLQSDGGWEIRAVTRTPDSDAATALADSGIEVVSGNYDDEESLITAFDQYFADGNDATAAGEKEQAQMYTIASAASKIDSLEHFILLSMPAGEKLAEDLHVPQFDFKDRAADQIIADCPDLIPKTNFLWSGVFTSNFWEGKGFDKPFEVPDTNGIHTMIHPSKPNTLVPFTNVSTNIGVFVSTLLAKPEIALPATYINCVKEVLTYEDALKIWSEVTGRTAVYVTVTDEDFQTLYGPGSLEFVQQMNFLAAAVGDWTSAYGALDPSSVIGAAELGIPDEELVDFRGSLEANKDSLLSWSPHREYRRWGQKSLRVLRSRQEVTVQLGV